MSKINFLDFGQVENFLTKIMDSWPKADALEENNWLEDPEDIKQIHMFFLGMEHGIRTVARRGGLARTKSMSHKRRSQSARKAARARWSKS